MATHLSNHFRQRRLELGLSLGQLAAQCGYSNLSKGANRIAAFEQTGKAHPALLRKLAAALEVTPETMRHLSAEDYREWKQWVDAPVKPRLVVRIYACLYNPWPVPERIKSQEEAEKYAAEVARSQRKKVALVWSRRLTIYFNENGERGNVSEAKPGEPNSPWIQIGGKRIVY